jgi:hypothetical protein
MTLVEVIVVVSLSAVLLGVVISLAVSLQHWDSRFRDHAVQNDQLTRLTESIRSDIRRANDVSLPNKNQLAISTANGIAIRYEIQPEGCRRVTKQPGATAERTELFTIKPDAFWTIERETAGRRPAIVVSLQEPGADAITTGLTQMLVYAALGADVPDEPIIENAAKAKSDNGASGS